MMVVIMVDFITLLLSNLVVAQIITRLERRHCAEESHKTAPALWWRRAVLEAELREDRAARLKDLK